MSFKVATNEGEMIWLTYNVCLIRLESIKVDQSVCNRRRNRPRPREGYVGTASREIIGKHAPEESRRRKIAPFTILSFPFRLGFFFIRDVCNLPGRDCGRCRNFSPRRTESENEFSFSLLENTGHTRYFSKQSGGDSQKS